MGILVYRSMKPSAAGGPEVDASRTTLGVKLRDGPDILMDEDRLVYPRTGGLSVAPEPNLLPTARRPKQLGGTSRFPVWVLDLDRLPEALTFRATYDAHGLIEPAQVMRVEAFQAELHRLQPHWKLVEIA